jgi:hypothetical protein
MDDSKEVLLRRAGNPMRDKPAAHALRERPAADHLETVRKLLGDRATDVRRLVRELGLVRDQTASGPAPSTFMGTSAQASPVGLRAISRSLRLMGCVVLAPPGEASDRPGGKALWITFSCPDATSELLKETLSGHKSAEVAKAAANTHLLTIGSPSEVSGVAESIEDAAQRWRIERRLGSKRQAPGQERDRASNA